MSDIENEHNAYSEQGARSVSSAQNACSAHSARGEQSTEHEDAKATNPSVVHTQDNDAVDVSVIVPCYNCSTYVYQAVSSILKNHNCALEVIVLNDGSTDTTPSILQDLSAKDARMRVIDKANEGYGKTVNRGIDEAKGTYIAILEADDWIADGAYDELFHIACQNKFPDIVKSAFWCVYQADTPAQTIAHCNFYKKLGAPTRSFTLTECPRLLEHHPSIWSCLYKRAFLREKKLRFQELPGASWVDTPFNFRALACASSIFYTDNSYYYYRVEAPGSSSATRTLDLSFARFQDMMAIARELAISDRGILEALYTVGFSYVEDAIAHGALQLSYSKSQALIMSLYASLDPSIVAGMDRLSKQAKNRYASLMGKPTCAFSSARHARALAGDFAQLSHEYGAAYALSRAVHFLAHRISK